MTADRNPVILVADDSRLVTVLFRRILEQNGATVITTSNGSEALQIGLEQAIDLAVIDQVMPGRVGAEVLQAWRAAGVDMPVIMVSAIEDQRTRDQAVDLGASAYLYKPISGDELMAQVNQLLNVDGGDATR